MKLKDVCESQLKNIIDNYVTIKGDKKKKEIVDDVIDDYLALKEFEYKGRKRTCDYYQKGSKIFIKRVKDSKITVLRNKKFKSMKVNKFDYAFCFIKPENFKYFRKMFNNKTHYITRRGLSTATRLGFDLSFAGTGVAAGCFLLNSFILGYLLGIGGLITGFNISSKINDKLISKNTKKAIEFSKWYNDYMFYDKNALERLLK